MPVNGALSILCKDFSHFEAFLFHNSPILIDGDDFVDFFDLKNPMDNIWGGEYLAMVIKWRQLLSTLLQCQIDPVWMFSASVESRGQQFAYRLENVRRQSKVMQSLVDLQVTTAILQSHPVNAQSVLIELLSSDNRNHIRSPFCLKRSCAIVAALLDCPLLASSVEYFLLSSSASTRGYPGFAFVPLQFTNLPAQPTRGQCPNSWPSSSNQPCSDASERQCAFLHAHRFVPELSSLNGVQEFYRPLLFLLLGSDAIPRINLPRPLYSLMNDKSKGDYKTRRWNTLCSWLSTFKPDSMEPIDRILATYTDYERSTVLEKLCDSVVTYTPDMETGSRLICFLDDSVSCARLRERVVQIARTRRATNSSPTPRPVGTRWKMCMQQILRGNSAEISALCSDFTTGWPDNLIKAYHQSALCANILVPLYNTNGVVLPVYVTNPQGKTSVHDASMALRLAHYRILAGLEHTLGQSSKLVGLNPCVKEYALVGTQLMRYSIPVTPLPIDVVRDGTDSLLSQTLGLLITADLASTGPLTNLAIALAIWHYQSESSEVAVAAESPALTESPLALAILVCAVATWFNAQSNVESLCQHYQTVADAAEQQRCSNAIMLMPKPSQNNKYQLTPAYRLEYVHEYNAVQLVYTSFRSLVSLLNQMVTGRVSILPDSPATWIVFPSGRLVHWIAACLNNLNATVRLHYTVRFWMPRLLHRSGIDNSANSAQTLRAMCQQFDKLLKIACSILPDRVPGLQVSHTKEPVMTVNVESFKTDSVDLGTSDAEPPSLPSRVSMASTNRVMNSMPVHAARSLPKITNLGFQPPSKPENRPSSKFRPYGKRNTGYAARLQERLAQHEAGGKMS